MTEREHEPSVASLLGGIVGDAQALVRQEIGNAKDTGVKLATATERERAVGDETRY
jgi:hypothetical protein